MRMCAREVSVIIAFPSVEEGDSLRELRKTSTASRFKGIIIFLYPSFFCESRVILVPAEDFFNEARLIKRKQCECARIYL